MSRGMAQAVYATLLLICLLAAHSAAGIFIVDSRPSGDYCGGYMSLVNGRITVHPTTSEFDISLDVFGEKYLCKEEKYSYNETTGQMFLDGVNDPDDCLGTILRDNGLKLSVTYLQGEDAILLDFDVVTVKLSRCS
ncbi:hypothetical protein C3747_23g983c [Trypanosoma cruzi]|uniref:Uncharacterized protein n=2 Tax=Trypanosoma cruzi TaxID=5693 RepID=Q4DCF8_TRYCC|nr:hypothetical protein, conserved [Trypanosoma cruzi]EAN90210.1 hypothetical protein, conserved [Trypanosoma cruzi]PWV16484.1 hypothetical protein C3747_23g983c [Trypanosoma cruzi]|eukprot:XP_812061.1 hypothetical protein [Trypanosoma cruzi strain CL Brener]